MLRKLRAAFAAVAAAGMAVVVTGQEVRFEAENGVLTSPASVRNHASASGGKYVKMESGNLSMTFSVPAAGFYTVSARYSNTYGGSKTQNVWLNGSMQGEVAFPVSGTVEPTFATATLLGKAKLGAGNNTVEIRNNWGWTDIDYIQASPYVPVPFTIASDLVTPGASENARKVYTFLRQNFQKKVISGIMTNQVAMTHTLETQGEVAYIKQHSGKIPAIVGFDFFHGTGLKSNESWFKDYNSATLKLAEELWNKGGIPIFCWHWKDPLKKTESSAFYTKDTDFDLRKAFTNNTYNTWNTTSPEYIAMLADIDIVAGYLKTLADKNIPVLWRPLHEAAGGWFWWGRDKEPKPCAQLWRLLFDRMVNHHGLKNLIWVWTTEESGRELEWYPGAAYADIVGRDIYAPRQNYNSLVANFENIKSIFGTNKIIALAENGPIPHPDSLAGHEAHWSWFMPWYGEHMEDHNSTSHWRAVMNHSYVITLEDMPGWSGATSADHGAMGRKTGIANRAAVTAKGRILNVTGIGNSEVSVRVVDMRGKTAARFKAAGAGQFSLAEVPAGRYMVEAKVAGKIVGSTAVVIK